MGLRLFGFTWYLGIDMSVTFKGALVKEGKSFPWENFYLSVECALNLKIWFKHMTCNSSTSITVWNGKILNFSWLCFMRHPPQAYQGYYSRANELPGVSFSGSFIPVWLCSVHSAPHEDFYHRTGNWMRNWNSNP